jgi:HD superfamily phosphohydrolase
MKHLGNLKNDREFTDKYFKILSPDFPDFLHDYINTSAMQRLKPNSISCGCNYTDMHDLKFKYSNLSHSIGVALIIWNFTRSREQTLAGLFHDLANPSFKHCIDFMNGDYEKQVSIDKRHEKMLLGSSEIQKLLKRDGIKNEEIISFEKYPIADNDTPKLSSDRLEYTFANGYFWKPVWDFDDIAEIYGDLIVLKNEDGADEIGFKTLKIAEKFMAGASQLWPCWVGDKNRITMQFIADIVAKVNRLGLISIDDLYEKSEDDLIKIIKNCGDAKIEKDFETFQNLLPKNVHSSPKKVPGKYCRVVKSKKRYIVPLVKTDQSSKRITELSQSAKQQVDEFLNRNFSKFVYLDIEE